MRTTIEKLESRRRFTRLSRRTAHRRGMIVIAVLVLFSVSLTLFGLWSRAVIREHRTAATQQFRIQATRLAEAGLKRALLSRASNAKYDQEVWSVPAAQLDSIHTGQVRIRVAPTSDDRTTKYEATAEFPAGALHRAQITKSVEIPNSVPMNKS
jgi:Tfp pilus assembly protein PilX